MGSTEAAGLDPVVARIPAPVRAALQRGTVIPAHLLALDAQRRASLAADSTNEPASEQLSFDLPDDPD